MSTVVVANRETGARWIHSIEPGSVIGLAPTEYVVSPYEPSPSTERRDALILREVEALERQAMALDLLTERARTRNELHAESIAQGAEFNRRQREMLDHEREQRDMVAAAIMASPMVAQAGPMEAQDVQSAPEPEPAGMFAVLRDPATAPSGWVNQVKRTYGDRDAAIAQAQSLASKHGGRFIVLEATGFVEATAWYHDGAPYEPMRHGGEFSEV